MKDVLNCAIIGLGQRGTQLLNDCFIPMAKEKKDIAIVAVCDLYTDRVEQAAVAIENAGLPKPSSTENYSEILENSKVDAVVISSAWESHIEIAIAAMRAGKYVAMEVAGAYSLDDCFELVRVHEETGAHLMLLENCCYGKRELMIMNMVREGIFGSISHCEGGYCHDLRGEVSCGEENRHYRLRNYLHRNCENYPTHELGPIAKLLDINNGNRIVSLSSHSSCAQGLNAYIAQHRSEGDPLLNASFAQGDIVTTVLTTALGQTITISLDTTLPRAYSRRFTVRGTKAAYFEDTDSLFIDGEHNSFDFNPKELWGNAEKYEEHLHPLWKDYVPHGGHDGMDWMELRAFVEAARANVRPPIDVYDAAVYMSVTPLSEQSIACGGAPVAVPDFTRGKWCARTDINDDLKYTLDRKRPLVCR